MTSSCTQNTNANCVHTAHTVRAHKTTHASKRQHGSRGRTWSDVHHCNDKTDGAGMDPPLTQQTACDEVCGLWPTQPLTCRSPSPAITPTKWEFIATFRPSHRPATSQPPRPATRPDNQADQSTQPGRPEHPTRHPARKPPTCAASSTNTTSK